ncbi:hypothetical protein BVRB_2g035570 [Beta vulgaris subsp. vulgaris]|nr:hypothetical protein BVRB_2g035570 [Beta vulgaris subsp. vulgaris]
MVYEHEYSYVALFSVAFFFVVVYILPGYMQVLPAFQMYCDFWLSMLRHKCTGLSLKATAMHLNQSICTQFTCIMTRDFVSKILFMGLEMLILSNIYSVGERRMELKMVLVIN